MKATSRVALVFAVLASIALAGSAGMKAAEPTPPPTVGGTLSASERVVTLRSDGNVPATVSMTSEGPFTLEPATFDIDPGQTVAMAVAGDAKGRVSAHMAVARGAVTGDTSSVTLQVGFPQPAPPQADWTLVVIVVLLVLAFLVTVLALRYAFTHFSVTRR